MCVCVCAITIQLDFVAPQTPPSCFISSNSRFSGSDSDPKPVPLAIAVSTRRKDRRAKNRNGDTNGPLEAANPRISKLRFFFPSFFLSFLPSLFEDSSSETCLSLPVNLSRVQLMLCTSRSHVGAHALFQNSNPSSSACPVRSIIARPLSISSHRWRSYTTLPDTL